MSGTPSPPEWRNPRTWRFWAFWLGLITITIVVGQLWTWLLGRWV